MERVEKPLIERLQRICKEKFSEEQYKRVRRLYCDVFSFFYRNDLNRLAEINRSDKWGFHEYTKHYQCHFKPFKNRKINILEIGIGGDDVPGEGGASLRMWKYYFPRANIYGVDIFDKTWMDKGRIKTFRGDQSDEKFLLSLVQQTGGFDIIIDDGSHINEHIIKTFTVLFPTLKMGGFYAIEDLLGSYDPRYGGDNERLDNQQTAVNFIKTLVDNANIKNITRSRDHLRFVSEHIAGLHFYHNLAIIKKDVNTGIDFGAIVEKSVEDGTPPWVWVKDGDQYVKKS